MKSLSGGMQIPPYCQKKGIPTSCLSPIMVISTWGAADTGVSFNGAPVAKALVNTHNQTDNDPYRIDELREVGGRA
jgi:hypothetical protein